MKKETKATPNTQTKQLSTRGWLQKTLSKPLFGRYYVAGSIIILLGTVIYWTILGSRVQLNNADAIVDPYLFKDNATFHGATFPGQHSMLLKWPLFFLIKTLGFTSISYTSITIAITVATVAALAYIMYRIEQRPITLGTLYLALASVLLLVPAQPYAGGLLPVNMAMLATRNIEYIVYVGSLILLMRASKVKSWQFWAAVGSLSLLIASDRLFLTFGLGAAAASLVVYALVRQWELVTLSVRWVIAQLLAFCGALLIVTVINATKWTHIINDANAGPYTITTSGHNIALGGWYALTGLLTNLGANPAFSTTLIKEAPRAALSNLTSIGGLSILSNLCIALGGAYMIWKILQRSLTATNPKTIRQLNGATRLSLMLVWTTIVAIGVFIATNHYYASDARYLTIVLITVSIAGATYIRQKVWSKRYLVGLGVGLLIVIGLGAIMTEQTTNSELTALNTVSQRNNAIAAIVKSRPTDVLVGDYWRVVTTKFRAPDVPIMPLASCTLPRTDLSSSAWSKNLYAHSFTYLLSYDQKLTDYPNCSLTEVLRAYGHPNASVLVAGTPEKPKEQLLFYDHGSNNSSPAVLQPLQQASTVLPISLDEAPYTSCTGPSIMAIVAHQDDDLLFMNPDLQHAISSGYCVRTVFITAGNAGLNQFYWLGREQGSEAAYSAMINTSSIWVQRIVKLDTNEFVSIANPKGNPNVSLIFMHLPDGDLKGQGFSTSHYESLEKLYEHRIATIHSIDGQSSYSANQLINALSNLMLVYAPAEIYTQSTYSAGPFPDHSDHVTVGKFTQAAYAQYETKQYNNLVTIPIKFYSGYPVHSMPQNLSANDARSKESIFLKYAQYDSRVCHTIQICRQTSTYSAYLTREYQRAY